jgi:hypothetical protein
VPILNADGTRKTINSGISSPLTIWNFRSAYNVAALNCQKPQHADILIGYKKFLVAHKKGLASAAASADGEFKKRYGTGWIRPRDRLGCYANGAVAQLGERVVRNDEVRGSIPLGSTSVLSFAPFRPANGDLLRFRCSRP